MASFALLCLVMARATALDAALGTTIDANFAAAPATEQDNAAPSTEDPSLIGQNAAVESLTIIMAATRNSSRLSRMRRMCRHFGYCCLLLGNSNGTKWQGYQWMKDRLYIPQLERMPPTSLAVMMDAEDVIMQAGPASAVREYRSLTRDTSRTIVLSLESGCPSKHGVCADLGGGSSDKPGLNGIPGLQHANGGFVMGPVGSLLSLWRSVGKADPQIAIGQFAAAHPELVALDERQRLVATIVNDGGRTREIHDHFEVSTIKVRGRTVQQLRNRHTKSTPCFMHLPGTDSNKIPPQLRPGRLMPFNQATGIIDRATAADTAAHRGLCTPKNFVDPVI